MKNKALSMIGLCAKARRLVSGEYAVDKSIKTGTAYLVIVAGDASDNTKKSFGDSCKYYNTPIVIFGTKEELGKALGKEFRASIAITDENFAKGIMDKINDTHKKEVS